MVLIDNNIHDGVQCGMMAWYEALFFFTDFFFQPVLNAEGILPRSVKAL